VEFESGNDLAVQNLASRQEAEPEVEALGRASPWHPTRAEATVAFAAQPVNESRDRLLADATALVAAIDEESPEEWVRVRRRGLGDHDEPAQLAVGLDRPEPGHDPPAAFVELGRERVGERLVNRGDEPFLRMVRRQAADVSTVAPQSISMRTT
jgi:hypothetical protein